MIIGSGAVFAQPPELAPFFQGDALPLPPHQSAKWEHGDDPFSQAVALLFEQGLANPTGLEYREIEIAVGNPWSGGGNAVKTHGWILPKHGEDGQFAVAWNGLVYPVVRVGEPANLKQDWAPDAKTPDTQRRQIGNASESSSISYATPSALKMALLLRLGETETVARISKLPETKINGDPYLSLARDWTWYAFERAVCAHERGDDRLALVDARLLTKVEPLVDAEAERRGIKLTRDYSSRDPDGKQPYLPFLKQLPALLKDSERRVANREHPSPARNSIAALVEDLQNVDARQWGQPGGVSLAQDERVQTLVKRGAEAVEPLLEAMEMDTRLTRSVSFGRDFHRSRDLLSASDAAFAALEDFLHIQFKAQDEKGKPYSRKELAAQIRAYWVKMGALTEAERFYATLKDDQVGADQWLQAAANIIQPRDVEVHDNWTITPKREAGQKIQFRGEALRDGRAPSVSELLAKRSDDIAAIRTHSTGDHFLYVKAGQMALNLAEWDKTAAIPTLKKRLARAWSIGSEPHDILAFNGNPAEHFGRIIAEMTLARVSCGDETAYDEYAAWIQKAQLERVSFGCDELQKPLSKGAARPSIKAAIDYLFNDPQSPWSHVFAKGNGFWIQSFWKTAIPCTPEFRKQALYGLKDYTVEGTITFNPRQAGDNRAQSQVQIHLEGLNTSFLGPNDDPDTPPPGEKRSFRICDAYAYFYSQDQKGPKFQLFWPEAKRDAAVLECRNWLKAMK